MFHRRFNCRFNGRFNCRFNRTGISVSIGARSPATARAGAVGALALSALLAACGTVSGDAAGLAPVETRSGTAVAGGTAGAGGADAAAAKPQSEVARVDLSGAGGAGAAGVANTAAVATTAMLVASGERVVYFDFNSFAIRDEYRPLLDRYARVLSGNRSQKLVVEGHTDERGGREYNLALGQKRAASVAQSLTLLGATEGQIEAVSYGKERPAVNGADEAAWARNRRAELRER
jgi:peptidoglycan-associated lipoprotein